MQVGYFDRKFCTVRPMDMLQCTPAGLQKSSITRLASIRPIQVTTDATSVVNAVFAAAYAMENYFTCILLTQVGDDTLRIYVLI
jgi:hypothetical protein